MQLRVSHAVRDRPPALADRPGLLAAMLWSLRMRFWAARVAWNDPLPDPDVQIFALYHGGARDEPRCRIRSGLSKGLMALAHLYAGRERSRHQPGRARARVAAYARGDRQVRSRHRCATRARTDWAIRNARRSFRRQPPKSWPGASRCLRTRPSCRTRWSPSWWGPSRRARSGGHDDGRCCVALRFAHGRQCRDARCCRDSISNCRLARCSPCSAATAPARARTLHTLAGLRTRASRRRSRCRGGRSPSGRVANSLARSDCCRSSSRIRFRRPRSKPCSSVAIRTSISGRGKARPIAQIAQPLSRGDGPCGIRGARHRDPVGW